MDKLKIDQTVTEEQLKKLGFEDTNTTFGISPVYRKRDGTQVLLDRVKGEDGKYIDGKYKVGATVKP